MADKDKCLCEGSYNPDCPYPAATSGFADRGARDKPRLISADDAETLHALVVDLDPLGVAPFSSADLTRERRRELSARLRTPATDADLLIALGAAKDKATRLNEAESPINLYGETDADAKRESDHADMLGGYY